jgi:hypothetical protein
MAVRFRYPSKQIYLIRQIIKLLYHHFVEYDNVQKTLLTSYH